MKPTVALRTVNNRPAVVTAVFAAAGVLLSSFIGLNLAALLAWLTVAVIIIVVLRKKRRALLYGAVFLICFLLCTFSIMRADNTAPVNRDAVLNCRVVTVTQIEGGYRYAVDDVYIDGEYYRQSAVVTIKQEVCAQKFILGDQIEAYGLLTTLELDFSDSYSVSMYATEQVYKAEADAVRYLGRTKLSIFEKMRLGMATAIDNNMSQETAAFAKGLLLGERDGFSQTSNLIFARTGVSHIFSVSGLHLGYFLMMINLVLGKLANKRRLWFIAVCGAILLFMGIVGQSAGTFRAAVMYFIFALSKLWYDEYDVLSALGATATLALIITPFALFDVGFLLSALSVLGISCFYTPLQRWLRGTGKGKIRSAVSSALAVTVSANIIMLPLSGNLFDGISLMLIPANLLIVPMSAIVFSYLVLTVPLAALVPALGFLLAPAGLLLEFSGLYLALLASLSFAFVAVEIPAIAAALFVPYSVVLSPYVMIDKKAKLKFAISGLLAIICLSLAIN